MRACEAVYLDRNFTRSEQLAEKYRDIFDSFNSPDTLEEVAESYAARKSYLKALAIYDKLFSKARKDKDSCSGAPFTRCASTTMTGLYVLRMVQSGALNSKKSEILGEIFFHNQQYADALECFDKVAQKGKEFEIDDPNSLVALDSAYSRPRSTMKPYLFSRRRRRG